jgi:Dinucleotide-utilizing enzymes involved in molybdopterin and thiamine biosynthesis family 2
MAQSVGQSSSFSRAEAFERNRGLITIVEQEKLAASLVAIAGCGGVGGLHAHTCARLGIGRFRIVDSDNFSPANINRQIGATIQTIGRNKAKVTAEMIRSINSEATVEIFEGNISEKNAAAFVRGADLVIDGVDFFALDARRQLFRAAWSADIPSLTAAPLGFSATLHVFAKGGMSFDDYFDLHEGQDIFDQLVRFFVGLAPRGLQLPYMDLSSVDIKSGRGPSSILGTQLAASIAGGEAIKILLGRDKLLLAPWYLQVDGYRQMLTKRRLRHGNRNWVQRLKRIILTKKLRVLGIDKNLKAKTARVGGASV